MKLPARVKVVVLIAGDVVALYVSLAVALVLRYGAEAPRQFAQSHVGPFTAIFPLWLVVFFVAGLYDLPKLRNNLDFLKTLALAVAVSAFATVALFYLIPAFGITPKTTLIIFIVIFALLESWWRHAFNVRASFREGLNRVLLLDRSPRAGEIHRELAANPQFGYDVRYWSERGFDGRVKNDLRALVAEHGVNLVVVPAHIKNNAGAARALYELLALGVEVQDLPTFYETVFRKVPVADVGESWFIEHNLGRRRFYNDLKRGIELVAALVLVVVLSPLLVVIALLIVVTAPGPAVCAQVRVGQHGTTYAHYKFRTMRSCTEKGGAKWTASLRDPRITPIGRFLRYTHLDELPQLVNILKGDMSFVGPRPERPEFVELLRKEIPHYDIRHLLKPGITGWAQINYRYGASVNDAREKLQYDIYYLKNRSLVFDLAIVLKTLRSFFVNQP